MAQAHIFNGQGCPICFGNIPRYLQRPYEKYTNLNLFRITDYVKESKNIHGEKYDYSFTNLDRRDEKKRIKIICYEHGEFFINPLLHLKGKGCQKCAFILSAEKTANKTRLTLEEFIARARITHGDLYSYEHSAYRRLKEKITITCKSHGDFRQTASDHLHGNGCQKCSNYATSKMEQEWLSFLKVSIRRKSISINKRRFYVDGFDENTNTIFEFLGDYWHGNPERFEKNKINTVVKKSFGQLYIETNERLALFEDAGYNVVSIWETDWLKQRENNL